MKRHEHRTLDLKEASSELTPEEKLNSGLTVDSELLPLAELALDVAFSEFSSSVVRDATRRASRLGKCRYSRDEFPRRRELAALGALPIYGNSRPYPTWRE